MDGYRVKREAGENPALSRSCVWMSSFHEVTGGNPPGRRKLCGYPSQKTCLNRTHGKSLRTLRECSIFARAILLPYLDVRDTAVFIPAPQGRQVCLTLRSADEVPAFVCTFYFAAFFLKDAELFSDRTVKRIEHSKMNHRIRRNIK